MRNGGTLPLGRHTQGLERLTPQELAELEAIVGTAFAGHADAAAAAPTRPAIAPEQPGPNLS